MAPGLERTPPPEKCESQPGRAGALVDLTNKRNPVDRHGTSTLSAEAHKMLEGCHIDGIQFDGSTGSLDPGGNKKDHPSTPNDFGTVEKKPSDVPAPLPGPATDPKLDKHKPAAVDNPGTVENQGKPETR
jgi:hypothetical protein